jgi:hypothetical protein
VPAFEESEAELEAEAAANREEQSAQDRYRQTDDVIRLQRVFPPGTLLTLKVYDPAASGGATATVSGERLAKLIVGAREMFRFVLGFRRGWLIIPIINLL